MLRNICFFTLVLFPFLASSAIEWEAIKTVHNEPATHKMQQIMQTFLVAEKDKSRLTLYGLFNNEVRAINTYTAITGKVSGDKELMGDLKTPTGIYFFNRMIPRKYLQAKHGKLALATNYPNPIDAVQGKTGGGIWLHGVETFDRLDRKKDTEGCVAVSNNSVFEIFNYVELNRTPIIISNSIQEGKIPGPFNPAIEKLVQSWATAWSQKDLETYISFYDKTFSNRGMNLDQWKEYKNKLNTAYKYIDVKISRPFVFEQEKYTVAIFLQQYKSDRYESTGLKRLYLTTSDNKAKILFEESL